MLSYTNIKRFLLLSVVFAVASNSFGCLSYSLEGDAQKQLPLRSDVEFELEEVELELSELELVDDALLGRCVCRSSETQAGSFQFHGDHSSASVVSANFGPRPPPAT